MIICIYISSYKTAYYKDTNTVEVSVENINRFPMMVNGIRIGSQWNHALIVLVVNLNCKGVEWLLW